MLRLAGELGWLARVPKIKKPRVRVFDRDFRYLRTTDEVKRVLVAAREKGDVVFALYATAIYTGMREGELAGLRWDDIDFERRLITVQRSYEGPTKSGDVRYVPIVDALLPILREWKLRSPLRVVFPSQSGNAFGRSARVFQEVLHRVLESAGLALVERRGKLRSALVFHDFRHTFASHWMMNGGDIFRLQRVLGHASVTMTMRYAHLAPEIFSADNGRFGEAFMAEGAEVVPLATAQRG
jgi:integrase